MMYIWHISFSFLSVFLNEELEWRIFGPILMENLEICVFGRNEGLLKGPLIYNPVHNAFAICCVFFANLICHKENGIWYVV